MKVLGITLDREADIISVAALVLSLSTTATGAYFFFKGDDTRLLSPDGVALVWFDYGNGQRFLHVVAPMLYINSGHEGYNSHVLHESMQLVSGPFVASFDWAGEYKISWNSGELELDYIGPSSATVVEGGDSTINVTMFAPSQFSCGDELTTSCENAENYVDWQELNAGLAITSEVSMTFQAYLDGDNTPLSVHCVLELSSDLRLAIATSEWVAVPCSNFSPPHA